MATKESGPQSGCRFSKGSFATQSCIIKRSEVLNIWSAFC